MISFFIKINTHNNIVIMSFLNKYKVKRDDKYTHVDIARKCKY